MKINKKITIISVICIVLFIGSMLEKTLSNDYLKIISTKNQESIETIEPNSIDVGFRGYLYYEGSADIGDFIEWYYQVTNEVELKLYIMDWENMMAFMEDENRIANCEKYWTLSEGTSGSGADAFPYSALWYLVLFNMDASLDTAVVSQFNGIWHYGAISSITEPDPGEEWYFGESVTISWQTTGHISTVTIELYDGLAFVQTIATGFEVPHYVAEGSGSFIWVVSESLDPSMSYQIRIKNYYNPNQIRTSGLFTIKELIYITVTNPTATSTLQAGTTQTITWDYAGSFSIVLIRLYHNGVFLSFITPFGTTNDGSYTWTLDSSYVNYNDLYQIKIENRDDSSIFDYSDAYFKIEEPSVINSITITNPTSSSSYPTGVTIPVTWETSGSIPFVEVGLYYAPERSMYHLSGSIPNTGHYSLALENTYGYYDQGYQIYICYEIASEYYEIFGESFEIIAPEPIVVTSPTELSSWQAGSTHTITWTSPEFISEVDIYLLYNGLLHSTIVSSNSNDGSYFWTLPTNFDNYDDQYQIRVWSYTEFNDNSPAYFEITPSDSVTLTSPTSSSSWQAGSLQDITWTSTGSIANVNIHLYYSGALHYTLVSSTPNDGSYTWDLASSFTHYDDQYTILIEDSSYIATNDFSDAYFEITEIPVIDTLTVTSPTASSSWQAGSSQSITWTWTGSIANVDILLYYSGALHSTIATSTTNDGSYTWNLPGTFASYGDLYQIRIEDAVASGTYDYSAAYFEIPAPPDPDTITVTGPTSSSSWEEDSSQTITWTSTGSITSVNIQLYHSGVLYSTIATSTANDGSYTWNLPSSFTYYDDLYQIWIEDSSATSTYGESAAYFEIAEMSDMDSITVTSPTVSSSWQAGTTHTITWTSTGSISNVKIKLYYYRYYFSTIISSTANDGSYSWILPVSFIDYGDLYQIRIEDASDSDTYDISAAYFRITTPTPTNIITVTSPISFSSWEAESTQVIKWTSSGSISNVRILLYYNGILHSTIISSTANDGSYSWTLPVSFTDYGDLYQIRIEDASDSNTYDFSPAYFEISEQPLVSKTGIGLPVFTLAFMIVSIISLIMRRKKK